MLDSKFINILFEPFFGPDSTHIGDCDWINTFTVDERKTYHQGLFLTGAISECMTVWLSFSLYLTILWNNENYRNFSIFPFFSCLRRIVMGLFYLPIFRQIDSWLNSNLTTCVIFGYQDSFLSVVELEGLTHVCIARFVMARYAFYKWPLNKNFNRFYVISCILFGLIYSYTPLLGIGGTCNYDFSCTTCTYDMILNFQRGIVLTLFFLRSVKPVLVIIVSLAFAQYKDTYQNTDPGAAIRLRFTRNLIIATTVMLTCWIPLGCFRGYVVVGQLFYDKTDIINSLAGWGSNITWAMWLYWLSPALMVFTLMTVDEKVRFNMIYIRKAAKIAKELAKKKAQREAEKLAAEKIEEETEKEKEERPILENEEKSKQGKKIN